MRTFTATVKLTVSNEADHEDVEAYLLDAIGTMCGCLRPPGAENLGDEGDPMWGVENVEVRNVKLFRKPRSKAGA